MISCFSGASQVRLALEMAKANRLRIMPRVIITVPDKSAQPYRFSLDRKVVSLGRGSDNDIVIDSGSVSGSHAEMHRVEGGYELADLGSTNGVKFDGKRERVLVLRSGMTGKLGDVSFDFSLTEEELAVLGKEKPQQEPPIIRDPEIERSASKPSPEFVSEAETKEEPVARTRSGGGGGGVGILLLFLLLVAAAFFAGLAVRYQKDTDEPLISAIMAKFGSEDEEAPQVVPE